MNKGQFDSNWFHCFRRFPDPLLDHVVRGGFATLPSGAVHWAETSQGIPRRLESGLALSGRDWDCLRGRLLQRGALLQHNHRMVSEIFCNGTKDGENQIKSNISVRQMESQFDLILSILEMRNGISANFLTISFAEFHVSPSLVPMSRDSHGFQRDNHRHGLEPDAQRYCRMWCELKSTKYLHGNNPKIVCDETWTWDIISFPHCIHLWEHQIGAKNPKILWELFSTKTIIKGHWDIRLGQLKLGLIFLRFWIENNCPSHI